MIMQKPKINQSNARPVLVQCRGTGCEWGSVRWFKKLMVDRNKLLLKLEVKALRLLYLLSDGRGEWKCGQSAVSKWWNNDFKITSNLIHFISVLKSQLRLVYSKSREVARFVLLFWIVLSHTWIILTCAVAVSPSMQNMPPGTFAWMRIFQRLICFLLSVQFKKGGD